jgi:hypothetical protein
MAELFASSETRFVTCTDRACMTDDLGLRLNPLGTVRRVVEWHPLAIFIHRDECRICAVGEGQRTLNAIQTEGCLLRRAREA